MHLSETDFHEEGDIIRSSRSQMLLKTGILKDFVIFKGKHLCWSLFLIKLLAFRPAFSFKSLKETPRQVISCAYREIFKNIFFNRTPPVTAFLSSYCFSKRNLYCTQVT